MSEPLVNLAELHCISYRFGFGCLHWEVRLLKATWAVSFSSGLTNEVKSWKRTRRQKAVINSNLSHRAFATIAFKMKLFTGLVQIWRPGLACAYCRACGSPTQEGVLSHRNLNTSFAWSLQESVCHYIFAVLGLHLDLLDEGANLEEPEVNNFRSCSAATAPATSVPGEKGSRM
jgi:hypothetical protein